MYFKLIALMVTVIFTSIAQAEDIRLPSGTMAFGFSTETTSFAKIGSNDLNTKLSVKTLAIPLGGYEAFGYKIFPKVNLSSHEFSFSGDNIENTELFTAQLPLLLVKKYSDIWLSIIQISPGIQSDKASYKNDVFSLLAMAIWRYRVDSDSYYQFGFGVNRLFGKLKGVPMFSYSHRLSENQSLVLGLPISQYQYGVNDNLSWSAFIKPEGNYWRYEANNENLTSQQGTTDSSVLDNSKSVSISLLSFKAGLGMKYRLKGNFFLSVDVARRVGQDVEFDDLSQDSSNDISVNGTLGDMNSLSFSVGYYPNL